LTSGVPNLFSQAGCVERERERHYPTDPINTERVHLSHKLQAMVAPTLSHEQQHQEKPSKRPSLLLRPEHHVHPSCGGGGPLQTTLRRLSRRFSSRKVVVADILRKQPDVQDILDELTDEELDMAARTMYEYVQHPTPHTKELYASYICQRYLLSKKGNVSLATQKVKKTLQFRKEQDIEALMRAFDHPTSDETAQHLHTQLREKKFHVQGYDNDGRATLYFVPRHTTHFDKEWHLKEALYSIERAVACSTAKDATINAVVDFAGFSVMKHSPPMDIGREFLTTLRSHYAGQIHKIFLLDCPTSFHMVWSIFSPFIGTDTRSKIEFLSGPNKQKTLLKNYPINELPTFIHPEGGMVRELDVDEYLFQLPFHQAFGETITKQ
jgi:CRAL/TRIO domain